MHWTRKMNRARAGIFPTAVPADSLRSPREIPCRFCREFLCSQQGFHREISTCFRCRDSVENCLCWHSAGNLGLLPPSQLGFGRAGFFFQSRQLMAYERFTNTSCRFSKESVFYFKHWKLSVSLAIISVRRRAKGGGARTKKPRKR